MHVLGIDAGGTKTVCLLADEQGTILAEARGPGANLHTAGELAVEKVLHEVMESAIGDRGSSPRPSASAWRASIETRSGASSAP